MIKLIRCDDRLIHGQCVTQIIQAYEIKDIIVVDDYTASTPVMKRIFQMAVPKGLTAYPVTFQESLEQIRGALSNDRNTLILMRTPDILYRLMQEIEGLPKEFNIASVAPGEGKTEITSFAFFSPQEMDAVKKMDEMGVHIWLQLIPTKPKVEWSSIKNKYE